jgi:hypothetical protein
VIRVDAAKVAAELGLAAPDDRCIAATSAAEAWARKRRFRADPETLFAEPDVYLGTVLYAALLYKQRTQPQGFAGVDVLGTFSEDTGAAMSQIMRLIRMDPSVA